MKREDIKAIFAEATDEQLKKIMDLNGLDVEREKGKLTAAEAELKEKNDAFNKLKDDFELLKSRNENMTPETIFFDKDGTLIEFDPFWVSVSRYAIKDILNNHNCGKNIEKDTETILELLGITDNKTDVDSVLCKGTYAEIAEIIRGFLEEKNCVLDREMFKSEVIEAYNKNAVNGDVVPTCENIRGVLAQLQDRGINLCVVTTDNTEITHLCLEKLNIIDMFQYIYTDDGKTPTKPDPTCINEYCAATSMAKDKILMVGDTATDIRFAKNAGISVICVGDEENTKKFNQCADMTVSDISQINNVIGEL